VLHKPPRLHVAPPTPPDPHRAPPTPPAPFPLDFVNGRNSLRARRLTRGVSISTAKPGDRSLAGRVTARQRWLCRWRRQRRVKWWSSRRG